ncbi:MAG: hypothetical protein ACHQ0J_13550 [Candidatus Dormibacterales bacterium]
MTEEISVRGVKIPMVPVQLSQPSMGPGVGTDCFLFIDDEGRGALEIEGKKLTWSGVDDGVSMFEELLRQGREKAIETASTKGRKVRA